MLQIFVFFLSFAIVFIPFAKAANLSPNLIDQNISQDQNPNKKIMMNKSIDELLGPKDNFPFLPDNHRDSGTGRFSRFQ